MCMKYWSFRLAHDPIAGNKLLRVLRDTRERMRVLHDKEIANMKLIRVTFAVSVLAVVAMLSGCVLVPVGPGYYSGWHGYYGPSGSYGGRGSHGYR
jgi:hypothetical protein